MKQEDEILAALRDRLEALPEPEATKADWNDFVAFRKEKAKRGILLKWGFMLPSLLILLNCFIPVNSLNMDNKLNPQNLATASFNLNTSLFNKPMQPQVAVKSTYTKTLPISQSNNAIAEANVSTPLLKNEIGGNRQLPLAGNQTSVIAITENLSSLNEAIATQTAQATAMANFSEIQSKSFYFLFNYTPSNPGLVQPKRFQAKHAIHWAQAGVLWVPQDNDVTKGYQGYYFNLGKDLGKRFFISGGLQYHRQALTINHQDHQKVTSMHIHSIDTHLVFNPSANRIVMDMDTTWQVKEDDDYINHNHKIERQFYTVPIIAGGRVALGKTLFTGSVGMATTFIKENREVKTAHSLSGNSFTNYSSTTEYEFAGVAGLGIHYPINAQLLIGAGAQWRIPLSQTTLYNQKANLNIGLTYYLH